MKSRIAIIVATLFTAGLINSCKDNPVSSSPLLPTQVSESIDSLVASIEDLPSAPEWPLRVDSTRSDTSVTADTLGGQVKKTTWFTQNISYSASSDPQTFMEFDPLASVLWPGNLVQGNSIASGVPNSIPVSERGPGNITLSIISGDSSGVTNKFYRTIDSLCYSNVNQAMNSILAGYHGGTPAKYSYSMEQVYSATQLNSDLDLGYSGPTNKVNAQFNIKSSESKTYFAVKLTQQFFTMVFDDPEGASGVFSGGITARILAPYVYAGNPLCYISSVTYGRIYILVYESSASSEDLTAALSYAYSGGIAHGSIKSKADFNNVMSKTTVTVMQIGGDPEQGLTASTALSFDAINAFLARGANFSSTNVGAPISYTIKYLKDATLVRMNNVLQYTVSQKTPIDSSTVNTQSSFNIYINDLTIGSTRISPDGGCKVVVGVTDNITGQDSVVWTCPLNNGVGGWPQYDGTGGWWDFGAGHFDAMTTGRDFQLNWTVKQLMMYNNADRKIWIDFFINDYNGKYNTRNWGYKRLVLEYNMTLQRWTVTQPTGVSATELYVDTNPDVAGTFHFTVTINGYQIQE